MAWDIQIGDVVVRRQLHQRVGGSWQGGITRPAKSADVLLFSSPAGARFGYDFDGWKPDGAFHYTGEGQVGDQTFVRGNAAVRDHLDRGLQLRFFDQVKRSVVRYLGEFRVDPGHPWYAEEARDRLGDLRKVIVFRLLPVDAEAPELDEAGAGKPTVRDVPMEAHRAETFQVEPKREPTIAERREADLVDRYVGAVTGEGGTTTRKEIKLPDLGRALYTDLFDGGRAELVEAKSSAARHHVRLALGQLLDYARYVEHKSRAVLLPSYPGSDLVDLLHSVNVACIYEQEGGGFVRLDP
nr:hypothetical protein OHB51_28800 [Micromonospora sp. NBC_00855]